MHICPTCKSSFSGGEQFCPRDGTPLRASLPEDPLSGRVLSGRYRLIEVIGRGGMGAVYRAHHILMDKPVAVKVLRQELASDTEAVARFHREARSASRLDHEHIIRVSDFGQTDDGLLFLIMELLDGENLAEVARRGPLPWRRAAAIARDVALGLSHAHEQGVIHRDLKPENIVLVRRGKSRQLVKVLDFGLAKLISHSARGDAGGDGAEPDLAVQSLTRTGVVFGTPEYMSPEQAEGRPLDPRTDLYALGVVLYQMLCGKLPFSAMTFLALIAKTVNEPPPPLRSQNSSIVLPSELESLVLRCLAKQPEDRPDTADEIAETLDQLLATYPDENLRSGEISVSRSADVLPTASGGGSAANVTPAPAGGVARTVQRLPVPSQVRPAGREANRSGSASAPPGEVEVATPSLPHSRSGPTSLSAAFAAVVPASGPRPAPPAADEPTGEGLSSGDGEGGEPAGSQPAEVAAAETGPQPAAPATGKPKGGANQAAKSPASERVQTARGSRSDGQALEVRRGSAPSADSSAGEPEAELSVPRRPLGLVAIAVLVAAAVAVLAVRGDLGRRLLHRPSPVVSENDPLARARDLLAQRPLLPTQVEEALRILRAQRETLNTSEVQRLLSLAYEAQDNRLRALGHLYAARQLGTSAAEQAQSELALAQLLSRLGHTKEACQTARKLLATQPALDVTRGAQALIQTEHCP